MSHVSAILKTVITTAIAGAMIIGIITPATTATALPQTTAQLQESQKITTKLAQKTVKVKPKLTVKYSKKKWASDAKRAKLSITAKTNGKAASGRIALFVGKKKIKTLKLKQGKTSYTLPKLSAKKHTIRVKFTPTGATAKTTKPATHSAKITVTKSASQKIVAEAKKHIGVKYRSGGTSPRTGFDCSGFTSHVYKKAINKKLPRTSSAQKHSGKKVSRSQAKPGDLIWTPGHVAIYLGNGKMIDAPTPGKAIQVRNMWQSNPTFIRL